MNALSDPLLEVSGLTKRYGSVTVLDNLHLQVHAGEIHALLGANGAGKSTTVRIIAGLVPLTSGAMQLSGTPFAPASKRTAERAGVQIVQQELNLIPTLTVAENLFFTRLPHVGGVIRGGQLQRRARDLLDRFELREVQPHALVSSLGVGHQQMVEIATALDQDCRLLILDEPTAALTAAETEKLFQWLERLRTREVGIIYISHRLDEVARIANRITVLRDGVSVGTFAAETLTTDEMVNWMSGEQLAAREQLEHQSHVRCELALRVAGLSRGLVQNVSLQVHAGERLGIFGLVGAGRTELLRLIFGADRSTAGHLYLGDDRAIRFRHPSEAVAAGIAMVTEDRKENGLLLTQSVRVNTTLAAMRERFSLANIVVRSRETHTAREMCQLLETRCTGVEQVVSTLSGGNQQKVAVAKWLVRDAQVFLFDEPTRGIDVATRRRIYRLLETLASQGKGIVIASSDLDELLETCDRVAVMSNGRIVATYSRHEWSRELLMQAAFAGYLDQRSA